MNYFTKSYIFLYIVVFVAVFILYKTVSLPYNGVIDIEISKQNGGIITLDTPRNISNSQKISIDHLYFPRSRMLTQKRLGKLGFSQNFFIDATVNMDVLKAGKYRFLVSSDDGFRLKIDNKTVCEHPENRPYSNTECKINLSKALHSFKLEYFQGGGPLGLHVRYGLEGLKLNDIGEDSEYIVFKEQN